MSMKPKAADPAPTVVSAPAAMAALPAPATAKAAETVKAIESAVVAETAKIAASTTSGIKDGMAQASAKLDAGQVQMKQGMEKAMKTAEELVAFGQGNVEAMVKSSQIWSAGVQDLSKQVAASAQATFDETMSTFKAMTSVKSLKDVFDLQASFARSAFEKSMSESGKLTDASMKLTEQALAPITARMTLAVEKLAKPV